MIPLEVVIRNAAAGSFTSRFGMAEGTPLPRSIVEFYYNSDELGRPMVTEEHITAFGWATPQDIDEIMALSLRINDYLSGVFVGIGMRLMDVRVEFGRLWEDEQMRIVLADEVCPDSCRLWDMRANQRLDLDRSRSDDANPLADAYIEVARRLGILPESGPSDPKGPDTVQ